MYSTSMYTCHRESGCPKTEAAPSLFSADFINIEYSMSITSSLLDSSPDK